MKTEYEVIITKQGLKDWEKVKSIPVLKKNVQALLQKMRAEPYTQEPPYEKLQGRLKNLYSRRLNKQHRLVYMILEDSKQIKVLSMWSHYE